MSRAIKYVVIFLLIVLVAWWYWCSDKESESQSQVTQIEELEPLVDRLWIDHIPTTEREKVDLFLMLQEPTIGVFSKSSAYEGDWASFEWGLDGGLHLVMLQNEKKHKIKASILKGPGCAPFDYCMKLKGAPRGSKKYGSMEDWVINANELPDARTLMRDLQLPQMKQAQ